MAVKAMQPSLMRGDPECEDPDGGNARSFRL